MRTWNGHFAPLCVLILACFSVPGCGGGGIGGGGGGGGKNQTQPVTGLTATAGNAEVTLNWNAYPGAVSYNVYRSSTSGIPSGGIPYLPSMPTGTTFTDVALTNGTTYYYAVNANGSWGVSNFSNQVSVTPSGPSKTIAITVDALANPRFINMNIYGGAFPKDTASITDSFINMPVRWGGNGSSTYNWQLGTYNASTDSYFEDLTFCGLGGADADEPCTDSDSTQFIKDVKAAYGGTPLMTMPMLPWVAQGAESSGNGHWSFSVARDGPQCQTDPQNSDAGDGISLTSSCDTQPEYLTASTTDINDTYVPLLDDHSQSCPSNNCVYRDDWINAIATAYGGGIISWEMDNEMDMWGTTHRDIHPNPSGYDEMASIFSAEVAKLRATDPDAVVFGPVSCCWWLYWNGANSSDKAAHAGIDFLPWWLNQIYWQDQISGSRSLDTFDIHAFPDAATTDSNGNPLTQSELQALTTSIYRDYWDPTFVSPSPTINQPDVTSLQPDPTIPFRIPRMRALINTIYPGTPLAITAWSAAFAGESDFSTALADADAYGIMGREGVDFATRWKAPDPANPNYWAHRLYTNYDGYQNGFGGRNASDGVSVSASNNGDPNLFSSYASLGEPGMTIVVVNKDPQNSVQAQFTFKNFTPTSFQSYTLVSPMPTTITPSASQPWSSTVNFPPYSATLLAIAGNSLSNQYGPSWVLNPDAIMVPAGQTLILQATSGGQTTATLSSAVFDGYEGAPACTGQITLTNPQITSSQPGSLTFNGLNPGFCHFTVTGTNNSGTTETHGGWIIVGNPAATLPIAGGNNQTGTHGTTLPVALSVNLVSGSSGGTNPASGAGILFSTTAGTLSNGSSTGSKVIATTNSSGIASVMLALPSTAQTFTVTAEGPYGLGHPTATFTETAQ